MLEQTSRLAFLDHEIQVFVIDHLLEIDARRLYLSRGFSGLFDYVKRGLGYSDAAAWRRINGMKLCAHVEGAGAARRRSGSAPSLPPLGPPPEQKPVPDLDVSARKALVDEAAKKSRPQADAKRSTAKGQADPRTAPLRRRSDLRIRQARAVRRRVGNGTRIGERLRRRSGRSGRPRRSGGGEARGVAT